jgi:hypothetical protein
VSMGCFSGCCEVVFADYPRGVSSRSIPLADEIKKHKKQSFPFGPIYLHWPAVNSQSFNH